MNTLRSLTSILLLSFLFISVSEKGIAQDSEGGDVFAPPYNRIGLTPLLLKPDSVSFEFSMEEAFEKTEVPSKFDGNQISDPHISVILPGSLSGTEEKESAEEGVEQAASSESSESSETTKGSLGTMAMDMAKQKVKDELGQAMASNLNNPVYDSIVKTRLGGDSKVVQSIVDSLYSADEEGRYSMDRLLKRAKYNLTDAQATRLENTSKGFEGSVQDMKWANKILTSNYVMGFYFHDIKTMEEYYENEGISENSRTHVGYKAMVSTYLFKIDMNDSVRAVFYNKCWAGKDASEEELAEAKEARKKMEYPLELVGSYRFPVTSKQFGRNPSEDTKRDLFMELGTEAVKTGTEVIEKEVKAFKVRRSLFDYKGSFTPNARAKIGTKQGLQPDDRYFVYEYVADGDGGVEMKRRGVLRASSDVAVNDTGRPGNSDPSRFVQTAGWGLGKGMLIEQNSDAGLSFASGWMTHGSAGFFNMRLGIRISKMLNIGPAWYLYGEAGIHVPSTPEEHEELTVIEGLDTSSYDAGMRSSGLGLGLSKEFYFLNHFQLAPYIGARREMTRFTSDSLHTAITDGRGEDYGTVWTFDAGARLGMNITYWMKLVGTVGFTPISYEGTFFAEEATSSGDLYIPALETTEPNPFHQERGSMRWELALRFTF